MKWYDELLLVAILAGTLSILAMIAMGVSIEIQDMYNLEPPSGPYGPGVGI